MSASPSELFERASNLSIADAVRQSITQQILAIAFGIAAIISALFGLIVSAFETLGEQVGAIPAAILGGGADIIQFGAGVTAAALEQFGIVAFIIGIVIVLIGIWILIQFLQEPETGDFFPGIPFDLPIGGVREEEE